MILQHWELSLGIGIKAIQIQQGTRSSEADERREGKVDLPKVQLTQISILGVHPLLYLTFSEGNIGAARSSDPANERSCLSQPKITSKISISSGTYVQSASKQAHRYHYIIITYTSWDHAIWRTK